MPDSGEHTELLGHHLRPELLDVATGACTGDPGQ
jgi:hypothetical protein